jgi:PKD repeat protein
VTALPVPIAYFTPSTTAGYVPLQVTFTNNSSYANNYVWDFGNGLDTLTTNIGSTYTSYSIAPQDYIIYMVASNGYCTDTVSKIVKALLPPEIFVPNVFSPNDDQSNDVFFVRKGGKIERLRATEQFGDSQADDVSRYIPREVLNITSGIAVYDQTYQRVCFFLNSKLLVLDKYALEAGQMSSWMKWTTQMSSNLDVDAAAYIKRPGTQNYTVMFGGPNGQIYDMNGDVDVGGVAVSECEASAAAIDVSESGDGCESGACSGCV